MKLKLKVMNILYFVISAVAIVFLCITPLFKSTIVCHIDKDVIETFIEKGDIDEEAFDEFGIEYYGPINGHDFKELIKY